MILGHTRRSWHKLARTSVEFVEFPAKGLCGDVKSPNKNAAKSPNKNVKKAVKEGVSSSQSNLKSPNKKAVKSPNKKGLKLAL